MVDSVEVACTTCGKGVIVVPPALGQFKEPEGETPQVELPSVEAGYRLVTADEAGRFRCPHCGEPQEASELKLA
jgi:predicted RNA-binding Zn-ribbon protein involved in translation (DUF1610 family)